MSYTATFCRVTHTFYRVTVCHTVSRDELATTSHCCKALQYDTHILPSDSVSHCVTRIESHTAARHCNTTHTIYRVTLCHAVSCDELATTSHCCKALQYDTHILPSDSVSHCVTRIESHTAECVFRIESQVSHWSLQVTSVTHTVECDTQIELTRVSH